MTTRMLFVIGAPRSGTTMLERMLSAHSLIHGGPEPHLLTPLAHLGVWAKVDKAPYDHVLAAESQRLFVEQLPGKQQDYWDACRAYCDVLYGRYLEPSGKPICLDKTPAYGLILPFLAKVFPDGKYVVLTRHPAAIFSSFANSFFDGDFAQAHRYNPILERYIPALAWFLRQTEVPFFHVKYEDLVSAPEAWFERICGYIGVPFEPQAIEYGKEGGEADKPKGLGDPIGVTQHKRPSKSSLDKWPREFAQDPGKLELVRRMVERIDPEDLRTIGYEPADLWRPMESVKAGKPPKPPKMTRYRFERKVIVRLRSQAQKGGLLRKLLEKTRLACDVLLRE